MANAKAQKLVDSVQTVASLPQLYNKLMQVLGDARSGAKEVGNVLSEDPGMVSRMLKLANSSFYGLPRKVDTISQAVTLIGLAQVRDLVLASSVVATFKGLPETLVTMESFWQHSVATGLFARSLARQIRGVNVESFFVGGLLVDLGRLLVCSKLPEEMRQIVVMAELKKKNLHELELPKLGYDSGEVGALLFEKWNLPDVFIEAARFQYRPMDKSLRNSRFVAGVHVGQFLSSAFGFGNPIDPFVSALSAEAWKAIGVSTEQLPHVLSEVDGQFAEALQMLDLKPNAKA